MSEIEKIIKELYEKGKLVDRKKGDKLPTYKRNTGKGYKVKNYLNKKDK